jgi:hypothetical protein
MVAVVRKTRVKATDRRNDDLETVDADDHERASDDCDAGR